MEDKKQKLCAAALACVVLLAGLVWFLCAGRGDVSDIGDRADTVRNELGNAESSQSRTAESLDRASDLAESAERDNQEAGRGIEKIEEGNRNLQDRERGDAEIITESQSILNRVRERGPAQGTGEG